MNSISPYQLERLCCDKFTLRIYKPEAHITAMMEESSYLCVVNCLERPNQTYWVVNSNLKTAKDFIKNSVAWWIKIAGVTPKKADAFVIEFDNGSKITSLVNYLGILKGKNGNVILNDFNNFKNQEELYHTAIPFTMWGGKLEIFCHYDPIGSKDTFLSWLIKNYRSSNNSKLNQGDKEGNDMT